MPRSKSYTDTWNHLINLWDTFPPDAKVFCVIYAKSGFRQVKVDKEASKFQTNVTNMERFSVTVMSQGVCNSFSLCNSLTDGDSRIDSKLNIIKNLDDFLLYGCDEKKLKVDDGDHFWVVALSPGST